MEYTNEIVLALITVITGAGSSWFTYLFARSKYKTEVAKLQVDVMQANANVDTVAIENDIKLSGHYKDILDDLKGRYVKQYQEFEELMNRKFCLLEEELKLKDRKIKLQQIEITELRRENKILKQHAKNNSPQSIRT